MGNLDICPRKPPGQLRTKNSSFIIHRSSLLSHWFYLLRATIWLAGAFARASRYFKNKALHDLELPHPESLTSKERRRLKHYFYGTTYLSAIFCLLRGHTRTRREKHLFTNLAALAYFFDDLVDTFRDRDTSGVLWQNNPEEYGQTADERGLALHFLANVYRELPPGDRSEFQEFMHRVFNVETAGRQQTDAENLTINDLQKITAEKGGCSVLLFRRVLAHPLTAAEREALFQFGHLIQLCDDIFDLWFDREAGICTLATVLVERNNVRHLTELFENQYAATRLAFRAIPDFSGLQKETALRAVHFVVTVTRVCLRHYRALQKKHGNLPLTDRAQMVVDMERWGNRLRAAYFLMMNDEW